MRNVRAGEAAILPDRLTPVDRIEAGLDAVRDIVGRVWMWIIVGIAAGAFIHGYAPNELLASIMGRGAWWSVPAVVLIGVPIYSNAAGIIPVVVALLGKGAALGTTLAFMMSVIALVVPGNGHPAQGHDASPDRRFHRRRRDRHRGGRLSVQCPVQLRKEMS